MMHADKYKPGYFPAPRCEMRWAKKDHIEKPPIWCSVDRSLVSPFVFFTVAAVSTRGADTTPVRKIIHLLL